MLVSDPTASDGPNNTIQWTGSGWQLVVPGGQTLPLPAGVPALPKDAPLLRDPTGAARVTLNLPLPAAVKLDPAQGGDSIQYSPRRITPTTYWQGVSAATRWSTPGSGRWPPQATIARQRCRCVPTGFRSVRIRARSPPHCSRLATRLAAIRTWLQLESPPDSGRFPYHVALKNSATGQLHTDGTVREGERYGLVLALDEALARGPAVPRYVYVFALDGMGKTTLLFPRSEQRHGRESPPGEPRGWCEPAQTDCPRAVRVVRHLRAVRNGHLRDGRRARPRSQIQRCSREMPWLRAASSAPVQSSQPAARRREHRPARAERDHPHQLVHPAPDDSKHREVTTTFAPPRFNTGSEVQPREPGGPNIQCEPAGFGQILNSGNARIVQFGLKFYF